MELTGTTRMADRPVDQLSGGELQRVWLASCLAQDTGVVLLDEPTNHLDLRYQVETLDLVRDLADQHGTAVGVVLHDLNQTAAVADRVVLLHHGRVHSRRRPADVLTAEHLTEVYEIPIETTCDPETGRLRIDPAAGTSALTPAHTKREEMLKHTIAAALTTVTALTLSACGQTTDSEGTKDAAPKASAECQDVKTSTDPVSLTDSYGRTVELDKPAERVAVLEWQQTRACSPLRRPRRRSPTPRATAHLGHLRGAALGHEDVGTVRSPTWRRSSRPTRPGRRRGLHRRGRDPEAQLAKYDVPVLATKGADAKDPIANMKSTFELIAEATGREERAEELMEEFDEKLEEGRRRSPRATPPAPSSSTSTPTSTAPTSRSDPSARAPSWPRSARSSGSRTPGPARSTRPTGWARPTSRAMTKVGDATFFYTGTSDRPT
ncbi:ABC transporter ATP-binding protein [Nocardioides daphniae]|uniref:ABC transporter ATP-binding protein n=1 Tax=Nocardioides daphniae TaxID=402297 RepID=UPI0023B1803A|nr:ATP-binding cassette domain-containing protein [Nocardioides daphniae]